MLFTRSACAVLVLAQVLEPPLIAPAAAAYLIIVIIVRQRFRKEFRVIAGNVQPRRLLVPGLVCLRGLIDCVAFHLLQASERCGVVYGVDA